MYIFHDLSFFVEGEVLNTFFMGCPVDVLIRVIVPFILQTYISFGIVLMVMGSHVLIELIWDVLMMVEDGKGVVRGAL